MIRTLFLMGTSDRKEQNTVSRKSIAPGFFKIDAGLTGVVPILNYVMNDRTLSPHSEPILVGVHGVQLPLNSRVNLFNLVGDADASVNALRNIQLMAGKIQPVRFFNRPIDVFKTSRERLPRTLADIPGCIVPRTELAHPTTLDEVHTVCEKFGSWPIIVRAKGYHGGSCMFLLQEPAQLERYKDFSWLYEGIYIIEFIDYKNKDGLYQKNRVMIVDGVAYPRHAIFFDQWLIHASSRLGLMSHDIGLCRREENFLAHLRDNGMGEYARIFDDIYQRIGLDVFGIDFAIVDGQIVIFEANACMSFLDMQHQVDSRYQYLDGHVKNLRRAVKKMLVSA